MITQLFDILRSSNVSEATAWAYSNRGDRSPQQKSRAVGNPAFAWCKLAGPAGMSIPEYQSKKRPNFRPVDT
jgi:hypothetical protein